MFISGQVSAVQWNFMDVPICLWHIKLSAHMLKKKKLLNPAKTYRRWEKNKFIMARLQLPRRQNWVKMQEMWGKYMHADDNTHNLFTPRCFFLFLKCLLYCTRHSRCSIQYAAKNKTKKRFVGSMCEHDIRLPHRSTSLSKTGKLPGNSTCRTVQSSTVLCSLKSPNKQSFYVWFAFRIPLWWTTTVKTQPLRL